MPTRCPVCREASIGRVERLKAALSTVARCSNCGAALVRRRDTLSHVSAFAMPIVIISLLVWLGLGLLASLMIGLAAGFGFHYLGPLKADDTDPITVHRRTRRKLRQAGRSRRP